MAKKYRLSRRLTYALALEACADDIYGGIGASDATFDLAENVGGNDDDTSRVQRMQEQIAEELRQRAAKIRARLG